MSISVRAAGTREELKLYSLASAAPCLRFGGFA